jgi:hypothetical protein
MRWLRNAAQMAVRAWWEETPSEFESSGHGDKEEEDKDEKEGEIIFSPHTPLPGNFSSPGGLFS